MFFLSALYRLSLAFWVGGIALFTFILTPALFRNFPRDLAGRIVGVLFPGYFRWGMACGAIALVCVLVGRGRHSLVVITLLLLMFGLTAFQAFYIEPRAAALKREIPSFETTPRDHPLRREFSRLHGVSAACNLAAFACGAVLILLEGVGAPPR